jgi:hypothetical protein
MTLNGHWLQSCRLSQRPDRFGTEGRPDRQRSVGMDDVRTGQNPSPHPRQRITPARSAEIVDEQSVLCRRLHFLQEGHDLWRFQVVQKQSADDDIVLLFDGIEEDVSDEEFDVGDSLLPGARFRKLNRDRASIPTMKSQWHSRLTSAFRQAE